MSGQWHHPRDISWATFQLEFHPVLPSLVSVEKVATQGAEEE